jgi:hypothetical protein
VLVHLLEHALELLLLCPVLSLNFKALLFFKKVVNWLRNYKEVFNLYLVVDTNLYKSPCFSNINFGFCYKCHNSRRRLHNEGHLFNEIGPEFASMYSMSETSSSRNRGSNSESDSASEIEDKSP